MAQVYVYDNTGFYVSTKLVAEDTNLPNSTTLRPDPILIKPLWVDNKWVEGDLGVPLPLSKIAFMDLAYVSLGPDLEGISRYGEIMLQAKSSISPLVVAAMERYSHASVFELEDVSIFLTILLVDPTVDVTLEERAAIISSWPIRS